MMAAVLAALYVLLAIKQHRMCWAASFVSSCLYVWVLFGTRLYMESTLNVFYAVMALYGYRQWSHGSDGHALGVSRGSWVSHGLGLSAVLGLSLLSSIYLRRFTPAAWPFVDSMITWSSVFATLLVARKVFENWHWWFVIDAVSVCLYWNRGLYLTMLLFGLYLAMIVVGMREWRRSLPPPCVAQLV